VFGHIVCLTEQELLLKRRYWNLTCKSCEKELCTLDITYISCLTRDKDYFT
jgi:hypothetical protein